MRVISVHLRICLGLASVSTLVLFWLIIAGVRRQAQQFGPSTLIPSIPSYLPPITAYNASHLQLLGIYGHGTNNKVLWGGDNHTLVVGGTRGVWLYDTQTPNAPPQLLDDPDLPVRDIAVSPDRKLVAAVGGFNPDSMVGQGGGVRVWELTTRKLKFTLQGNSANSVLQFTPDGQFLIEHTWIDGGKGSFYGGPRVLIWSVTNGQLVGGVGKPYPDYIQEPGSLIYPAQILHFDAPYHLLIIFDNTGSVEVWDARSNAPLLELSPDQIWSANQDTGLWAINWPNHVFLLFDLKAKMLLESINTAFPDPPDTSLSPDRSARASIARGVVAVSDARTGALRMILPGGTVRNYAISPDHQTLAMTGYDNDVDLIDFASHRTRSLLVGHSAPVLQAAFSPDGHWIATTSYDQSVRLWDAATGLQARVWFDWHGFGSALAFSPDSTVLAVGNADGTIELSDVSNGQSRGLLRGLTTQVIGMVFSLDSLLWGYDDSAHLWQWRWAANPPIGIEMFTGRFSGYLWRIDAVSPDGQTTVALILDGDAPVADLVDNTQRTLIGAVTGLLYGGAGYSPDGQMIAVITDGSFWAGIAGTIGFVSVPDRKTIPGYLQSAISIQALYQVLFSPDGRLLTALQADGTVAVWGVSYSLTE